MALLVLDCPRCGTEKITFDVMGHTLIKRNFDWQHIFEAFCVCRHCLRSTVFVLRLARSESSAFYYDATNMARIDYAINTDFHVDEFINISCFARHPTPEHLPEAIASSFEEGAACLSIACHNAAAAMFRLCIDIATKTALPEEGNATLPQPTRQQRRDLKPRLDWLFDHGKLPSSLRDLADCVREDGNFGVHEGRLDAADAADLLDFTVALLERIYTEPRRIELARERQAARRKLKP